MWLFKNQILTYNQFLCFKDMKKKNENRQQSQIRL